MGTGTFSGLSHYSRSLDYITVAFWNCSFFSTWTQAPEHSNRIYISHIPRHPPLDITLILTQLVLHTAVVAYALWSAFMSLGCSGGACGKNVSSRHANFILIMLTRDHVATSPRPVHAGSTLIPIPEWAQVLLLSDFWECYLHKSDYWNLVFCVLTLTIDRCLGKLR